MSASKYRLTNLADDDITDILGYTLREFGPVQLEVYWGSLTGRLRWSANIRRAPAPDTETNWDDGP